MNWQIIERGRFDVLAVLMYLLIMGADMRKRNPQWKEMMDDGKEKAVLEMRGK